MFQYEMVSWKPPMESRTTTSATIAAASTRPAAYRCRTSSPKRAENASPRAPTVRSPNRAIKNNRRGRCALATPRASSTCPEPAEPPAPDQRAGQRSARQCRTLLLAAAPGDVLITSSGGTLLRAPPTTPSRSALQKCRHAGYLRQDRKASGSATSHSKRFHRAGPFALTNHCRSVEYQDRPQGRDACSARSTLWGRIPHQA